MNKNVNVLKQNLSKELKNKTILVTGGAGSIGAHLIKKLLRYPVSSVRVFDIDENALFKLKRSVNHKKIRLLLGNILDKERLEMACNGADIIIHAAAVKNIEITEFNPIETIETNINGTVNMIKAALKHKPKKFLNISTDKAVEPTTLYGTTKQLGERLTSWAGTHLLPTKFSSVRFGNIYETRGNVFEVWDEELKNNKPLSITDPTMKRYFFDIDQAVDFILECLLLINKGEIFVPKMKSLSIKKIASKLSKNHRIIGKRPGEKTNEILITKDEKQHALELKNKWIIKPK